MILLNGQPVGRIEPGGIRCVAPGDLMTPEASEAFYKAVPFAEDGEFILRNEFEYMGELKRAPLLKADGLDDGYRLLAEFNGTVLDGQYELTESQETLIADTCKQIESLVPDLKEHIKQEQEAYEQFEQTM